MWCGVWCVVCGVRCVFFSYPRVTSRWPLGCFFFYFKGHPTMALGVLFPLPRVSPHGGSRGDFFLSRGSPTMTLGVLFPHVLQGRTLGLMSAAAFAQQDVGEKHREGHCGVTLGVKTFLFKNSKSTCTVKKPLKITYKQVFLLPRLKIHENLIVE